ncbi:MAG: GAF domain-containing protein [Anaerolineales bacterium]|nr:GAF domain-containing protein [Anaerolineales bacterium]
MTQNERILLILSDPATLELLDRSILTPAGYRVSVAQSCAAAEKLIRSGRPDLVILGDKLTDCHYLELASKIVDQQPTLPILLFTTDRSASLPLKVLRMGVVDWLSPPIRANAILEAVRRGLDRRTHWMNWLQLESRRYTGPLERRVEALETLINIGRSVTSFLELDNVLTAVVDAAVELTGAEEGSILLLDDESGELYMRAARNFQEDFVRTFRIPVDDTLAGEVVRLGKPIHFDAKDPTKIKTSYLVYALIYVPLRIHNRTIGVLGVDNRQSGNAFSQRDVMVMSALADYAAIAVENARLYSESELERNKLGRILTQIKDGVIVVDNSWNILLVNRMVRRIFNLGEDDYSGQAIDDVIQNEILSKAIRGELDDPFRAELEIDENNVFSIQVTELPGIGTVVTLHDITYLKEVDRLKTDFVNAVSHDLRSPLTSILGYVELIDRAGPINEKQSEFIKKVQFSVNSITELINDLLNLSRIEVGGLSKEFEQVSIYSVINYAVEGYQHLLDAKDHKLVVECSEDLPPVFGNPIQMRQVVDNLLGNAVKYTPRGGQIGIYAIEENGQILIQVTDNGQGIPPEEHPNIFDKFYRASNAPEDIQGTGLGLAIVKTIVENHNGRIWVDSEVGVGSTFWVILPVA